MPKFRLIKTPSKVSRVDPGGDTTPRRRRWCNRRVGGVDE